MPLVEASQEVTVYQSFMRLQVGFGRSCNLLPLLQEAFDIFGDVGDLLEIYDQRKREEADGAEEEQEPDFSDEEAAETFRVEQVPLRNRGQLVLLCML